MRRITTSYAATVRFMLKQAEQVREVDGKKTYALVSDMLLQRLQNRSFLVDWQDRLYHDSVLVRFEDGSSIRQPPLPLWRNFWTSPIRKA